MVERRSSHPCGGMCPLHVTYGGRAFTGHGAALPGRRLEDWREPHMGAVLRLSKAVLYRTRRRCLAALLFAALRHRGLRLWLAPERASLFAAASRPDVSRRRFITTLADPRSEYAALGANAGR